MRTAFVTCFIAFLGFIAASLTAHAQQRGFIAVPVTESGSTRDTPLYQRSYALVIGIDRYTSPAWVSLSNAINDAEAVAKELTKRGFEVTLKTDLKSTELKQVIEDFVYEKGRFADARLFIWYAGHGHTINGEGYLVPSDAPSPDKQDWKFRRKALSLREFSRFMREARAKHVLTVFDSCFSGTVFNTARSKPPAAITRATTKKVRQFVSSGEASQAVSDDGLFRKLFLDAITGRDRRADMNGDGYVIGSELGLFLHQRITNLTRNRQTPRSGKLNAYGYDRGDFVFRSKEQRVPVASTPRPAPASSSEAAQEWANLRSSTDIGDLEAYVAQFGKRFPYYGRKAQKRLKALKEKKVAVGVYPPVSQTRGLAPGTIFDDCNGAGWCPSMVVVPAGSFQMGSNSGDKDEKPVHTVRIAEPFAVGRFEVTWDEWDACVSDGGCSHKPKDSWGRGKRPVMRVSWNDITKQYLPWLSRKTGKDYRLLSEAEWEYVARAGTTTAYHWGNKFVSSKANNGSKTVPVGQYDANDFKVHDMHGNVWEWVEDCWHDNYKGAPANGTPWTTGKCDNRVLRGGSWDYNPRYLRSAIRVWFRPDTRNYYIFGFRLARSLSSPRTRSSSHPANSERAQLIRSSQLRNAPKHFATSLETLKTGAVVEGLERKPDALWIKVKTSSGRIGYVRTSSVKLF